MKICILSIALFIMGLNAHSQAFSDLFDPNSRINVTFYGLDFRHAKFIGSFNQIYGAGSKNVDQLKYDYVPAWNYIFEKETEKYNLLECFKGWKKELNISFLLKKNEMMDLNNCEASTEPHYSKDQIQSFLHSDTFPQNEGLGITIIVESFNKLSEKATYHFVVFDTKNSKILFQEMIKTSPKGIGLKNYWLGSVYEMIENIKKYRRKEWKNLCKF